MFSNQIKFELNMQELMQNRYNKEMRNTEIISSHFRRQDRHCEQAKVFTTSLCSKWGQNYFEIALEYTEDFKDLLSSISKKGELIKPRQGEKTDAQKILHTITKILFYSGTFFNLTVIS